MAIRTLLKEVEGVVWEKEASEVILESGFRIDLLIDLTIGRRKQRLLVEVKSSGEPRVIQRVAGFFKSAKKHDKRYPVLVAPFVSSRGRDLCKKLDLGFIDLAGNAFLKFNGVLIEKWGNDNVVKERRMLKSIFSQKSTWVIRKLFNEIDRRWTLMDLANESSVSLGQVYKVVDRLAAEGFLEKARGAITLTEPGKLLDAWTKTYSFNKHDAVGFFCPLKQQRMILDALRQFPQDGYALTLGAAASLVAPIVRSTDVYMYVTENWTELIEVLHLTTVEFGGNLYLVKPADQGVLLDLQHMGGLTVVSNLQLYLDLYNFPTRGKEQANYLRERVLGV